MLAAQNIAMQCFVKLCTKFGDSLVVSCYNFVGNIQARISITCMCIYMYNYMYIHVCVCGEFIFTHDQQIHVYPIMIHVYSNYT